MSHPLKQITFKKRYIMITWGIFLMVAGFYYFIAPFNLVIGGVSGVGLLFHDLIQVPISLVVFVLNVLLLGLAWLFLGFKSFYRSIYGSVMFPLILFILELIGPPFVLPNDYILAITFGGALMGIGFGYVIRFGGTSGGTDIPIKILSKKVKLPLSLSIYIIDGSIILSGVIVFYNSNGISGGLYAILTMLIAGKAADFIVIGANRLTSVQIITDYPDSVKRLIFEKIERGVSVVPIIGGYTNKGKSMLITVITKDEYYLIRNIIAEIDPEAFVFTNPASEIQGDFEHRLEED
ncbi:MAG: YitT family protein [Candidatus Izemoplasmataceae bacterium]